MARSEDECLVLVNDYRKAFARSRGMTPAGARSQVSDAVVTQWADALAIQWRRENATGGSRPLDLRCFATALGGLLEGAQSLTHRGDQCGTLDQLAAASAFLDELRKGADPRVSLAVDATVLVRAVDALRMAVRAVEWSIERDRDEYWDEVSHADPYDDDFAIQYPRTARWGRPLADADVDTARVGEVADMRALVDRLEALYVGSSA